MKKILSIILCLIMVFCSVGSAYAETRIAGLIFPSAEEQLREMEEQGCSAEEIAVAKNKLYSSYSSDFGSRNARTIHQLGITVYKQETWFYCTPAAMRSILKFLNPGFNISQDDLAQAVGANEMLQGTNDLASVRRILNEYQSKNTYVSKVKSSLSTYKGDAYTAVETYKAPMLTNISTEISATEQWPHYDGVGTTGHTVVLYGISSDMYTSYYGDPIAGTNFEELSDFTKVPQKYPVNSGTAYACLLGYMY